MNVSAEIIDVSFTKEEQSVMHTEASRIVTESVMGLPVSDQLPNELAEREINGVFVSLKNGDTLRGCCGVHNAQFTLRDALKRAAIAATCDRRMVPVSADELADLNLSVSLLDAPKRLSIQHVEDLHAIEIGRHGLRIQMGERAGLLLPSVARERQWNAVQFLEAVCAKAQLPSGSWQRKDARLSIFAGVDFGGQLKTQTVRGARRVVPSSVRAPAVADRFYPHDDTARDQLVDKILRSLPEVDEEADKKEVAAAMVPHAGLRYSGRIAASVWRRIKTPSTVIIIGPKHTRPGANWAVSPCSRWQLSENTSMAGAADLAKQLANEVTGMELDDLAHKDEHGIEVQLPLLYRLDPAVRVIGIAMGSGTLKHLRVAASSMARWIERQPEQPLLVISSDMNHFANDRETRRKDRLALEQLESNNPEALLKICQSESISMCGRLPAAFVLMTLQHLGLKTDFEEVAYATSAEVNGNKDRVVGYAGVVF